MLECSIQASRCLGWPHSPCICWLAESQRFLLAQYGTIHWTAHNCNTDALSMLLRTSPLPEFRAQLSVQKAMEASRASSHATVWQAARDIVNRW